MKAPVLGLYGEADQGIPLSQVDAMKAALQAANKTVRDQDLSGRAARLPCRLPAELPQGSGRGCLEPDAGLVQEVQSAELSASSRPQSGRHRGRPHGRPFSLSRTSPIIYGIWISSLTCSADSGAGMNLPATASAMIASIPSTLPVAMFAFGMRLRTRSTIFSGSLEYSP